MQETWAKNRCSSEGCTSFAVKGGVCVKHGAKVKLCSSEGCTNQTLKGGVCTKHGAKVKLCSSEGCSNKAQQGGVCIKHGATRARKRCKHEGCNNHAVKGGVCIKHGAKFKRCSYEGCTNQARKGGVCKRHGAYSNPNEESTAFTSCYGSELEKTTATHPIQRASAGSTSNNSVPEVVVVEGEVAQYEEV